VVAQAHLDSVELWIPHAQIGVGDVPPSAANLNKLPPFSEYLNSAATPRREVEVRGVSRGEVGVGAYGATRQFDVWRGASRMQAGVPPQNERFKTAAVYCLWLQLPKHWDQVECVFEAAAPPTAADFASQHFAYENSRGHNLRFGKRVEVLFTGRPSHPDADIPIAMRCFGKAGLRIYCTDKK